MKKRIALFASGSGTNVENIFNYFRSNREVEITKVFCNNSNAGVIDRCKKLGIAYFVFSKKDFIDTNIVETELENDKNDLIVLAGFLLLIPPKIIKKYHNQIINIHPALLPNYGGKGMYGDNVHKAVVKNRDKESGISIHLINEKYDEGEIIFQAKCSVLENDTYSDVAEKVHALEYEYYPQIIEKYLFKDTI